MSKFLILHGPEKWELILALFDSDDLLKRFVTFIISKNTESQKVNVFITNVGRINGDEYTIYGIEKDGPNHVHIKYSPKTRKGRLEFVKVTPDI